MLKVEVILFILDAHAGVLNDCVCVVFCMRVLEIQHRVLMHHGCGVAAATPFAPGLRPPPPRQYVMHRGSTKADTASRMCAWISRLVAGYDGPHLAARFDVLIRRLTIRFRSGRSSGYWLRPPSRRWGCRLLSVGLLASE